MSTVQQHITVEIPQKWIDKAQELWKEEQIEAKKKGMKNIFFHPHGWTGKIGEWAVKATYKDLTPVTQDFNPTKYDFISTKTDLIHEVKTNAADRAFEEYFHFNVNNRQLRNNNNNTYIGCYYPPGYPHLRICGWLKKEQVKELGYMVEKGTLLSKEKGYKASEDFWKVKYSDLEDMADFPE